jgi:hypothetical protein
MGFGVGIGVELPPPQLAANIISAANRLKPAIRKLAVAKYSSGWSEL